MKRSILIVLFAMFCFLHAAGITIGPNARVSFGNSNVGVYGNLKNTLTKTDAGEKLGIINFLSTSKVSFLGSAQDTVTNIYTFPNVVINKPSGNVKLNNSTNNFLLTGNISFTKGNVLTGTNIFEMGSTATVTGESINGYVSGTVKAARAVGAGTSSATGNFGGIGYQINNTGSDLGTVTVYRYSGDGSEVVIFGSEGIWRKWSVQTSNAFSGTRQVTSSWLSNEDNGNTTNLKVWEQVTSKSPEYPDIKRGSKKIISSKNNIVMNKSTDRNRITEIDSDLHDEVEELPPEDLPKTIGWIEVDGASFNTALSPRTATYTIDAATTYTVNDVSNTFADGAGTLGNPYQIATLDQLNNVRNYLTAHFIQIADIDASATSGWNSGSGWVPINNFTGKYNGDGHTVSNLFISRAGSSYTGLFGYTTAGSEIKDMGLVNVNITGSDYTGAFVGYSRGTVINCFTKGQVFSSTGYLTGGFVGYTGTGSNIYDCYSNAEVSRLTGGASQYTAGFCGYHSGGSISRCYSTGSVHYINATDPTNRGFAAYSSGTVTANFWNIETSGQTTTYGTSAVGLTKTQMRTLTTFTGAAWDFMGEATNGTEDIWGINAVQNSGYPFLSWEGFTHRPSPFAGGIGTSDEPFLVSNLTQLDSVRGFMTNYFTQTADIDAAPTSGWNSGSGWLPIGDATVKFTGNYNGQNFTIDGLVINRTTYYNGLFGYIQSSTVSGVKLTNVNITSNSYYTGSLIGYSIASSVSNCSAAGALSGGRFTGGLISYCNSSIISNCAIEGTVTATDMYTGGLTGYNYNLSTINNCFSNASVTATSYVGGIAGRNISASNIISSYAKGAVSGTTYVGGFIGQNYTSCQVQNCYSLSNVSRVSGGTSTYIGGFIGYNYAGAVINCYSTGSVVYLPSTYPTDKGFVGLTYTGAGYEMSGNFWNIETSGQTTTYGSGTATGLTSSQMRTLGTFTNAGWDFYGESVNGTNDYWNMHTSLNSGFPYLNWEYRIAVEAPANLALTVAGSTVTITWDPVTGASGYAVYSSTDPYGAFVLNETGSFNGTEWVGTLSGTRNFYYITATNDTKILPVKIISVNNSSK